MSKIVLNPLSVISSYKQTPTTHISQEFVAAIGPQPSSPTIAPKNLMAISIASAQADKRNMKQAMPKLVIAMSTVNEDFSYQMLVEHDLTDEKLQGTNFSFANLYGARFHRAAVHNTTFANANLTKASFRGGSLTSVDFYCCPFKAFSTFVLSLLAWAILPYG